MATGPAADEDPDECALCLDDLVDPRFLPCHHTFCATCIEDLASSHDGKTFPCPACRKETSLLAGGVAALQRNFYIKPAKKPRDATRCKTHEDQVLKFYCVPCERVICTDCKLTEHEQHPTQDLQKAAERAKRELSGHGERLQQALGVLAGKLDAIQIQKKDLTASQSEAKKVICDRHAVLISQADKVRNESLAALCSKSEDIMGSLEEHLKQEEQNVQQLMSLQDQVNTAVAKGTGVGILTAARQMKRGRGSEQALRRLTSVPTPQYDRAVLRQHATAKMTADAMSEFMGSLMASKIAQADMNLVHMFTIKERSKIYALCYCDSDIPTLYVSFENDTTPCQQLTMHGVFVGNIFESIGTRGHKRSIKRKEKGALVISDPSTDVAVFILAKASTDLVYELKTDLSGRGTFVVQAVTSVHPMSLVVTGEYLINVNANRAVDVDATEQVFVIVEEPRAPSTCRKVLMYRRPGPDPICRYIPPNPTCQPSDVCFYKLCGQEVVLVTDEANDAIHVVSIAQDKFTFLRYMTCGCSLLVQPTAMTVDVEGRLWVACANGDILTIKPKN